MKTLEYTFDTLVEFSGPVREHEFVLHCLPRRGDGATILREQLDITPRLRHARQRDSFGNELLVGSVRAPHDRIEYRSSGLVRMNLAEDAAGAAGAVPGISVAGVTSAVPGMAPGIGAPAHPLYRYSSPLVPIDEGVCAWAQGVGFGPEAFAGWDAGTLGAEGETGGPADAGPALAAFEALGSAVHDLMAYEPGSTTVSTTAAQECPHATSAAWRWARA